ncbi:DUF4190 domain-containing protein [Lentibacillus amyloliquefaciens]|uniref:DUF4190 domain-containing protein n=1 Tax=Lentibacillus amyloliquefaciens TaxID=1472767 RepID=A0A0U4FPH8_9BACI|nr:DUF4190 domain-containing protein [Lentibacillus amyloliquefaciens]ALX49652.1 hypothetical protein AOX59_14400 [Lentibacillus amyloliquefaciens]
MNDNAQTNGSSVISLTLGVLSIVIPFIGLFLGIIGIVMSQRATKEVSEGHELGRGLAISGLICSLVGLVIQALIIMGVIMFFMFVNAV